MNKEQQGRRSKIKEIAMAQWVNRLWNNIFVNLPPLSLSCEISGAIHLAQAGRHAGRQARRQAGKIQVNLKIGCRVKYSSFYFV